jgi:large subunit ribosomal protein L21
MYAIVEASGRQYQLEAGRFVDIDLVPVEPGQEFVFDQVLMIVAGKDSQVGEPYVTGAKVTGKVLSHGRNSKIIVYHMRPKKGTRKKQGHRQGFTRVLVSAISVGDKVIAEAKDEKKPAVKQEKAAKPAKASKADSAPVAKAAPAKAKAAPKAKAEPEAQDQPKAKKAKANKE